jgi:predicted AAA+ superfamily ATPase
MRNRTFWLKKIEKNWRRPVLWISGVRRIGKTCLCRMIPGVQHFDCELPRVRRMLVDPEAFLEDLKGERIVLDEIHRLDNPSEVLKIAADHYTATRVIATGSSTLGASAKFRDALTGRKTDFWLTPMMSIDLIDFDNEDLSHRMFRGGISFWKKTSPSATFRTGWMRSGPKTFRNYFDSSAGIPFRNSSNC